MKTKKIVCFVLCVFTMLFVLTACETREDESKTYILQYADDAGTHQISVNYGMPYSIDRIPQRDGYNFAGLFDSEVGGTQYVAANGSSVSVFTDKRNIVLFPQFLPQKYTLNLNYKIALNAGISNVDVYFGEEIRGLPNIQDSGLNFLGWYTTQDISGQQFSNGMIMDKLLASFADDNNRISLNAVFETETCMVRFYSHDGQTLLLETEVEYGTRIIDIAPKSLADGTEIVSWSTMKNGLGSDVDGIVTADGDYYVRDYICILSLDYGYGERQTTTEKVLHGKYFSLPNLTRENYKFEGWYIGENKAEFNFLVEHNENLIAKWSLSYSPHEGDFGNFSGGNGTKNEPYLIKKAEQLPNIQLFPNAFFILANDIDMSNQSYSPIEIFGGSFDGGGHTIANMVVYANSSDVVIRVGLFGTNNGTINDLNLRNCQFVASPKFSNSNIEVYCGAITGLNTGTIANCHITNTTVISNSSDLADKFESTYNEDPREIARGSKNWKDWISQSFDIGTSKWVGNLWMRVYSGGLVGVNSGSVIACSFSGQVESNLYNMLVSSTTVEQICYAGGLVGYNTKDIKQSESNAKVSAWIELDNDAQGMGWVGDTYPKGVCYACGLAGKNNGGTVMGVANGQQSARYRIYAPKYAFLSGANYNSTTKGHTNNLTIDTSKTYK